MKVAIAVLVFVLVAASWFWVRSRPKLTGERKFGNTDEFVQWLADEAAKDAAEQNHVKLDYSPDSIKQVEKILGGLHEQYVKNPKSISVRGIGSSYGAYVGEVIRRSEPGAHWQRDDETGEKTYPMIWGPRGGHSYPMAWCIRRITDGDEDNVWIKYRMLKDGAVDKALPPKQR